MLISPPFLPPPSGATDSGRVDAAMVGGYPGQGAYPVSYGLGWHGGIHLQAPAAAQGAERVRAIADGTVVYTRQCTKKPKTIPNDHPLNYRNAWTSDGCVVIKHETEIGATAQGQSTQVVFYSIYMHMSVIHANAQVGKSIYRKDEIGQTGEIYGQANCIHFEIICDDENLVRLIGRSSGNLNVSTDGRTDVIYGEMYFRLSAQTNVYADKPKANITTPSVAAIYATNQTLYIGMRYAGGDGANPGDLIVTTYREDGSVMGSPLSEHEAEYNLYTSATEISDVYRKANAPQIPAPSAVYELLRFGRVIGPDALNPVDTPHWRKISYDGGEGWVNLNAAGITKFSDADFPHWKGWTLIDDSADLDSRCDSPTIKSWLDQDGDGKVDPNEAVSLLPNEDIQAKLRRTLCKIPTEWERATVDFRWGWLKEETEENPAPLSDEDFLKLRDHIEALAFWEDANIGISSSHWHFQPAEFIKWFRKCGWLSRNEFAQCLPRKNLHLQGTQFIEQRVAEWSVAQARSNRWYQYLNMAMRKYLIPNSALRLVHFLTQIIEESGYLRLVVEGSGTTQPYAPWFGRGLIQLTHLTNYTEYGMFRAFPVQATQPSPYGPLGWNPDVQITQSDANCADTAGFYWVCVTINAVHKHMSKMADRGVGVTDVLAVSRGINGNVAVHKVNGLDVRTQLAVYLKCVLMDGPPSQSVPPTELLTFTWRNRSSPMPYTAVDHTINVILTPQRP